MEFNKSKLIKLLKEKNSLQSQGKDLRDFDKAKHDQLISYLIMIEDQIFWESRKEYIQILNLLVSKKITIEQFLSQFSDLRRSNLNSYLMLKNNLKEEACGISTQSNKLDFQLNTESAKFTKIIDSIYSWVDLYDSDITFRMNLEEPELIGYVISEEFLRLIIEKNYLPRLKKILH